MNKILDEIKAEELTGDMQDLSRIIGLKNVIKLIGEYGGSHFYVPKISKFKRFISRFIDENHDLTVRKISRIFNVSEQFLRMNFRQQFEMRVRIKNMFRRRE
jgi:hypothetical protein